MNVKNLSKLSSEKLSLYFKTEHISVLYELKQTLDDLYYNSEKSPFTDDQYDILKESIILRDKNFKDNIGSKIRNDDNRVKLPLYLGSIDKIKNTDEKKLQNWIKKFPPPYIIESKLDGCSCLFINSNGVKKIYTRGDGIIGADISHLIKYIKNIPKHFKDDITLRGELIIKERVFNSKYSKDFSNPRNMVSGLLNAKSLREGVEDINFIAYEIITNNKTQEKQSYQLETLRKTGFDVVDFSLKNELSLENLSEYLIYQKQLSDYEIDGIVIQQDSEYVRNIDKNPKYAFAFKMTLDSNIVNAEVEEVIWNISKFGLIKPRIRIKPVNLNGVVITYTSGFNAKYIHDKKIGKGSVVKLTRSGDVIPFIIEVLQCSKNPDMPSIKYDWNETGVDIMALEDENNEADIKLISSFFKGLDIK